MARKAAVDDGGVDGQKVAAATFRWRCVDVARWVVALTVTALIVAVTAHAVHVLLRPDDLLLRVNGGVVLVEQQGTLPANLTFNLTLEASNPSGRVAIYYENIKAYLYGKPNNKTKASYFAVIPVGDIALQAQSVDFKYLHAMPFDGLSPSYLDMYKPYIDLFNSSAGKGIPDGVVAVNGTLTIGLTSWYNKTSKGALYYCSPIAIGGDSFSENTAAAGSVPLCTTYPPTPEVQPPS